MNSTDPKLAILAGAIASDAREAPGVALSLGIRGLLFDAYSPMLTFPELSITGRKEFVRMLSKDDRALVGLRFNVGKAGFGPGAEIEQTLSRLEKAMDTARSLGSPLVCVEVGPLIEPSDEPSTQDQAWEASTRSALFELGALADRIGVVIAMKSTLSSLAGLDRAINAVACPWFGVDLDPTAILRDDWTTQELFSRLGTQIHHVTARDALGGTGKRTSPSVIGHGSVQWDQLLANLDATGYQGWITIDPTEISDRFSATKSGVKHLAHLRDE